MATMDLAALLALLLAARQVPSELQASAQESPAAVAFQFSTGPFERAFALVDPAGRGVPAALEALPPVDPAKRDEVACWKRWASAVRAASGSSDAAAQRAWLAALAHLQGRSDDAWEHLAHAGGDPSQLAAVLPLLFPGVEPERLSSWPTLPDGVLLTPALPPPSTPAAEVRLGTGRVRSGTARIEQLQVGAARIALAMRVEGDGVEVECTHLAGEPAHLRVRLPEPPDFELRSEYLDWNELEGVREAREIALAPGGEPVILFGRYRPRKVAWTTRVPPGLPAQAGRDGLLLLTTKSSLVAGLAAGLQQVLELRVEVRELAQDAVAPPFAGVVVDLRDPDQFTAKRAGLISVAERFALSTRR